MGLSLAIGPFTQQAIKTLPCNLPIPVSSSSVTLPIANFMSSAIDVEMKGAVVDGLVNPLKNHSVTASCPNGNCTFPNSGGITHSSVGLCNRCTDTTHILTEALRPVQYSIYVEGDASNSFKWRIVNMTGNSSTLSLPHGLSLGPLGPTFQPYPQSTPGTIEATTFNNSAPSAVLKTSFGDLDWVLPTPDPAFVLGLQASVLNFTILQLTDFQCEINMTHAMVPGAFGIAADTPSVWSYKCNHPGLELDSVWEPYNVVATSCTLYPCVKDYHAKVENTYLNETIVQETPALVDMHYFDNWGQAWPNRSMLHFPCLVDGQFYTEANSSKISPRNNSMVPMTVDNKVSEVPQECFYQIEGAYLSSLQAFLKQISTELVRVTTDFLTLSQRIGTLLRILPTQLVNRRWTNSGYSHSTAVAMLLSAPSILPLHPWLSLSLLKCALLGRMAVTRTPCLYTGLHTRRDCVLRSIGHSLSFLWHFLF